MCDFGEDSPPRVNFDTFFDAILAIFQVRVRVMVRVRVRVSGQGQGKGWGQGWG